MPKWISYTAICLASVFGTLPFARAEYTAEEKQQIAELKKTYPLTLCVVSGEKLAPSSMGDPVDYLYKYKTADGKEATRLVRFCCGHCVRKFNRDPQKYLKLLDEAAAKKSDTPPSTSTNSGAAHDHSRHGM